MTVNEIRYLPDFYIPSLDRWFEIVRILAPDELSEKEYYSRFVRGLWVVPDLLQ